MPGWKDRYYDAKFPGVDDAGRREVAAAYVEGLQWVMRYYYDGCASWKWFYPHHYAPFAADLAAAIDPGQPADFELARPFRPFEQLMGVLPPRSAHALPEPLAQLMTDPGSEIADFYPEDFALDLNGKKFLWQAVVLLPFIVAELGLVEVPVCLLTSLILLGIEDVAVQLEVLCSLASVKDVARFSMSKTTLGALW